tara:strand:- start:76 stop:312 length:237 start_codon:yes stop_codon:yes gene_type:complete
MSVNDQRVAVIGNALKAWADVLSYGYGGTDVARGPDEGIEIKRMPIEDDQSIWDRPGNCLRASNPRVVVCHCASCGGK